MTSETSADTAKVNADKFLDPLSRPRVAITLVALSLFLTALFYLVPAIDVAVSSLFFRQEPCAEGAVAAVCGSFPAASDTTLNDIRDFFHQMPIVVAVLLLLAAVSISLRGDKSAQPLATGIYVALAALIMNSLFIVNLWLKSYSGRPRPEQTDLFGGSLPFVPAGEFTDFCATNCSFISGESSAAFWLVGVAALFPAQWRARALGVAIVLATIAASLRVAFGGHYFSDAVIAGVASVATFAVLAALARKLGLGATDIASTSR